MKVERLGRPVSSAQPETKRFEEKSNSTNQAPKGTQQNTLVENKDGNIFRKIFPCLRRPKNYANDPNAGWKPFAEPPKLQRLTEAKPRPQPERRYYDDPIYDHKLWQD
jgi:hypothetical protein